MIYPYFRVCGAHEAVVEDTALFSITSHGDDIQGFGTRWDQALPSTSEVPKDSLLESVYKRPNMEAAGGLAEQYGSLRHPSISL